MRLNGAINSYAARLTSRWPFSGTSFPVIDKNRAQLGVMSLCPSVDDLGSLAANASHAAPSAWAWSIQPVDQLLQVVEMFSFKRRSRA